MNLDLGGNRQSVIVCDTKTNNQTCSTKDCVPDEPLRILSRKRMVETIVIFVLFFFSFFFFGD